MSDHEADRKLAADIRKALRGCFDGESYPEREIQALISQAREGDRAEREAAERDVAAAAEELRLYREERGELRRKLQVAERERDAYKRAKAENDERFMTERDDARAERDAALAQSKEAQSEVEKLKASMVSHFQREHLEGDGPEIDRWRAQAKVYRGLIERAGLIISALRSPDAARRGERIKMACDTWADDVYGALAAAPATVPAPTACVQCKVYREALGKIQKETFRPSHEMGLRVYRIADAALAAAPKPEDRYRGWDFGVGDSLTTICSGSRPHLSRGGEMTERGICSHCGKEYKQPSPTLRASSCPINTAPVAAGSPDDTR